MKTIIENSGELKKETKKRLRKMKKEFKKELVIKLFPNSEGYDQIIAQVGIPFTALCEHHHISFEGECSIAYIPDQWLTGLSKLGRVVEYYLNPTITTLQERATQQIINDLQEALKPKGLMVIIKAKHNCICFRGVKKPSLTITSAVKGVFKESIETRQEFLSLIK